MNRLVTKSLAAAKGVNESLSGVKAARMQVWLFLGPLFTLFTYLAFRDPLPISAPELLRVAAGTQAINLVSYALTRWLVIHRDRLSGGSALGSTAILFIWYVAFSIPGEVFKATQLGLSTEWIADHPVLWLSFPSSSLVAATWVMLSNLTVNWVHAARALLGELREAEARLVQNKQRLQAQLAEDLEQLSVQVREGLLPAVEVLRQKMVALQTLGDGALLRSAAEISTFCDTEVRALSHSLAAEKERSQKPRPTSRVGLFAALVTIVRNGDVSLNRMFAIMLTLAIPYAIDSAGYQALLVTVTGLSLGYLVLRLLDPIRRKFFGSSGVASFLSAIPMYLGISYAGLYLLNQGLPLYSSLWDFVDTLSWLLPGMLILVWLILGFVFGANDVVRLAAREIGSTNKELSKENDRLLAQASAARNRFYRLLHGSVQGRLAAVSLALTAIVDESRADRREQLLVQANEQMALAEADLRGAFDPQAVVEPFAERLESLRRSWRNLMTIEMVVDEAAVKALDGSQFLSEEVLSALQEGITNAHRHARANRVEATLESTEQGIQLRVKNDIHTEADDSADGTGIERIALGASSVKFDRGQDFAILTATWKLSD